MLTKGSPWIWMDGEFITWGETNIHIMSHVIHYGTAVFEGERAYQGKIFKMQEHHQRLHQSATMLGFELPYSVDELNIAAEALLEKNNLVNAYVRPIAWRGLGSWKIASLKSKIHVAIAAWDFGSTLQTDNIHKALHLMWSEWIRPAPNMAPVHAKASGLYIIGSLSKNKAELLGFDDALMLDYRGYVAECTGSNVFMVKDGILKTPIADCFLNGITRQTIIQLAKDNHIPCEEIYITPQVLLDADEIFVTGSATEIRPVGQIEDKSYQVGPITQQLTLLYKACIFNNQTILEPNLT